MGYRGEIFVDGKGLADSKMQVSINHFLFEYFNNLGKASKDKVNEWTNSKWDDDYIMNFSIHLSKIECLHLIDYLINKLIIVRDPDFSIDQINQIQSIISELTKAMIKNPIAVSLEFNNG
tara:strand:+ start:78 stop:437 length:360 start_codon:yes stop_codon:yes gene_type:complete